MLELNLETFPEIQTNRMWLRRPVEADLQALFELRSNPLVMQFIPRPMARTIEDARAQLDIFDQRWEEGAAITWAMCLKDNPRMIGTMGLWRIEKEHFRAEIGYLIHPDVWGSGLSTEATKAVVAFGFDTLGLHSIVGMTRPDNLASRNVLLKAGFKEEGHIREDIYFEGVFSDSVVYGILESDDRMTS